MELSELDAFICDNVVEARFGRPGRTTMIGGRKLRPSRIPLREQSSTGYSPMTFVPYDVFSVGVIKSPSCGFLQGKANSNANTGTGLLVWAALHESQHNPMGLVLVFSLPSAFAIALIVTRRVPEMEVATLERVEFR